ncbi:hypothetical protein MMC31_004062 [Peltigera leucophlebia]|nr:hypothetical protein [Peltigera leucophlebia]
MSTKQFDEAVDFLEDFHVNWSRSEEVPIPDTLTQAVHALAVTAPTNTTVASQFDRLGLDPRTLIGNYMTVHSINEPHIGVLIFSLIDGSQVLLQHQYRYPGEVPSPNQPRIMIDNELNKILQAPKANFPLKIKNAAIGMRKKSGPRDENCPGREHRVIGFQLDGMDEMGWVELAVQQNHQFHYFDLIAAQRW